ncbi:hypothetical protein TOPH_07707 [Tolypocladium ophioglossoides CBS 100239]|uniref:Uncharacterized protein n=1 Tax=Tolypocladium ophioglossoides (strain CBS 100239) TaxID=1163406 RepID=A0A0L0N0T7_TOLOC|nr:hypothetical protein TOPH_07707 [Tolypocladium ophioglossoides CBS 100239]
MRTLSKAVVDLPDCPTKGELDGVHQTALAVLVAIGHTPEDVALQVDEEAHNSDTATATATATGPGHGGAGSGGAGLKRKRLEDDTSAPRKAGTTERDGRAPTSDEAPPDLVHRCVRVTALIYCNAIVERAPTSHVCTPADFGRIWGWAWEAGLDRWSSLSGIFAWMMIAVVASSHHTVHGRMIKTLMVTAFMYLGTENWHIAADIAAAGLRIQRWLRGGRRSEREDGEVSGAFGGESVVERLGFAFKDTVPEVVRVYEDEGEGAGDVDVDVDGDGDA